MPGARQSPHCTPCHDGRAPTVGHARGRWKDVGACIAPIPPSPRHWLVQAFKRVSSEGHSGITHMATTFPSLLHVTPVIPTHSSFSSHVPLPGNFPQAALSCWRMDPAWQAIAESTGGKTQKSSNSLVGPYERLLLQLTDSQEGYRRQTETPSHVYRTECP